MYLKIVLKIRAKILNGNRTVKWMMRANLPKAKFVGRSSSLLPLFGFTIFHDLALKPTPKVSIPFKSQFGCSIRSKIERRTGKAEDVIMVMFRLMLFKL